MIIRLIKSLLILIVFTIFFTFNIQTNAQSLPIFYDFNDGNINNWEIISGNWSIQNISGNNQLGSTVSTSNSFSEIQFGDYLWSNYEINIDILPISGWDKNIAFRATNQRTVAFGLNLPIAYALHMSPTFITMQKFIPGNIQEFTTVSRGLPNGIVTHLKIKLNGTNIKVYLGTESEPIINWTDNGATPILAGRLSLLVTTGASYPSVVWFDNVAVTEISSATPTPIPTETPLPTPTPTPSASPTPSPTVTPILTPTPTSNPYPSLNVLDLKQYDINWKNLVYDSANNWSNNPTIERWGCALTSASMILNYYGHNILPDSLNTWLKNQSDGYLSNGLINWIAVTRYSKINSSLVKPALEYKRLGNDINILINELTSQRPAILEVPNHFIVAKSQTETSFGINDPAYSNKPTLLSYSNTYKSVRSFIPSFTDLSYILLTINPSFNLTVIDPNGSEITANTYIDSPLIDDLNNSDTSGNAIKVFELPKPNWGNYIVEVEGEGSYLLNAYLYDKNGKVSKTSTEGELQKDEQAIFNLFIGRKNLFEVKIDIKKIFEDLNRLHSKKFVNNTAYRQIKFSLNGIKTLIRLHKYNLVKNGLIILKNQIQLYPSFAVTSEAKDVLTQDINNLLKSF